MSNKKGLLGDFPGEAGSGTENVRMFKRGQTDDAAEALMRVLRAGRAAFLKGGNYACLALEIGLRELLEERSRYRVGLEEGSGLESAFEKGARQKCGCQARGIIVRRRRKGTIR